MTISRNTHNGKEKENIQNVQIYKIYNIQTIQHIYDIYIYIFIHIQKNTHTGILFLMFDVWNDVLYIYYDVLKLIF